MVSVSSFGKYIHWSTFSAKVPSFLEIPAKTPEFGTKLVIILLRLCTAMKHHEPCHEPCHELGHHEPQQAIKKAPNSHKFSLWPPFTPTSRRK